MISVEVDPQTDIYENFMCISDNLAMAEMAARVLPNLNQHMKTVFQHCSEFEDIISKSS